MLWIIFYLWIIGNNLLMLQHINSNLPTVTLQLNKNYCLYLFYSTTSQWNRSVWSQCLLWMKHIFIFIWIKFYMRIWLASVWEQWSMRNFYVRKVKDDIAMKKTFPLYPACGHVLYTQFSMPWKFNLRILSILCQIIVTVFMLEIFHWAWRLPGDSLLC